MREFNFGDDTGLQISDASIADGRINFSQPDGGPLFYAYVSGLTTGVRYAADWKQFVSGDNYVQVVGLSGPAGHGGRTGRVEFIAEGDTHTLNFRGHGTAAGPNWIDALTIDEVS